MTIFVYIANSEDMLKEVFGFSESQASFYYTIPYIIAAVASPLTGLLVDRVGHRPLFRKYSNKSLNDLLVLSDRLRIDAAPSILLHSSSPCFRP